MSYVAEKKSAIIFKKSIYWTPKNLTWKSEVYTVIPYFTSFGSKT